MKMLTLSGWAQPADALTKALGLDAATFDYSDYGSPEASYAALQNFADADHIIGWSMGGQLAMYAIAAGALKPKKLTLIGAPYQFVSSDDFKGGMDPIIFQQFRDNYASNSRRTMQRFHALVAKGDGDAKRIMAGLEHHPDAANPSRWLPWLEHLGASSLRAHDFSALPPTLIIHGASDAIAPIAQGEALLKKLPHAHLERWDDTGHAPHLRDKERLLQSLAWHIA